MRPGHYQSQPAGYRAFIPRPFLDGTGAAADYLPSLRTGNLQAPVMYLSHYFKAEREGYYQHLQDVRDHGMREEWLKFFLRGVADVSSEATRTARAIVKLRDADRTRIVNEPGRVASNALRVYALLLRFPMVSENHAAETLEVSFTSANRLIERMADIGILVERTGDLRNRVFGYSAYIELFQER